MNHEDERTEQSPLAAETRTGLPQADAPRFESVEAKLALRQQAEKLFREKMARTPEDLKALSREDAQLLLHKLQVHQIELEIQNEELWRAQVELDAARERYFELYDLAPVGYVVVNNLGLILDANFTAATLLGYIPGSLAKQPFSRFILKEDQNDFYLLRKQLLFFESNAQIRELRMVKRDETVIWVHLSITLVQDKVDAPMFRIVLVDITERKQSEEALRESEQNFKTLSNSGQALIWTSGTDKLCNYFNTIWLAFTGRALEQEMGNGWTEGVHPEDMQRCLDIYVSAFDRRVAFSMVYRLRRYDGAYRWILDDGCPRHDSKGEFIGYIGHCLDITEHKQAEEEIRLNESRLRRLVEILQHPAQIVQELLDYVLEQALQLTGSKIGYIYNYYEERQELVLNSWSRDVLPACAVVNPQTCYELDKTGIWGEAVRQRRALIINDFQSAHPLKKGYPQGHVELLKFVTIPIFKGQRIVSVVGLANKETNYTETDILQISLLMDAVWKVIDNMKFEEEKLNLTSQLLQAQKMEAIGTLAGGIAHDFNNILGAIIGYTEIAVDSIPSDSIAVGYLEKVATASHRAASLVKQILAFSRQAVTEDVALQPAAIIKEAIKILRPSLPSTITIKQQIDTATKSILADPSQLHQILMNLCTNAYHAMEERGGTLEITLEDRELSHKDLQQQTGVSPGSFVVLTIGDSGKGITAEIRDKIFDPYFTTKEVGKGTGMGLAIIHGIVKRYRGFITCETVLGKGTVFQVYFPAIEQVLTAPGEILESAQPGKERILFIDDEEMLADLGKTVLERLGYEVTVRTSSMEAWNTFKNQPDRFDIVITDQTMPGVTGSDLALKMLQLRPNLPIILCTGYSSLISEKKARSMGIKGFAMKPLVRKEIALLIRQVLDNKTPC